MTISNIKLHPSIWDSVSDEDKDKVIKILKTTSALSQDGTITTDSNEPISSQGFGDWIKDVKDNIGDVIRAKATCQIGCDIVAAAAASACTASTAGVGLAACLAAAGAAQQVCRDQC